VIVVFPEGTITDDPDLNPMEAKTGVSRLALQSKAPVIPCAVWGTANVWPKGFAKRWRPRQDLLVRIGEPLDLTGITDDPRGWKESGRRVMEEVGILLASLRPAVPDRRRPGKRAAA
jgi:1-acyl-sn-glycerol-3-phosphate acyltransferase